MEQNIQHLSSFYQQGTPDIGQAAITGINTFAHHRISIRAGKWRLVDPQGEEHIPQQFHLDVIFVGANSNNSKVYYPNGYDPEESAAPACWSDNGIAPSERVAAPRCETCAACPNNVIGSRMTPNNKPAKACSDSRRLAVILADNPNGPVYELRVPPASLKNMANAFRTYNQRGIKIETMIWQLTFEMDAEYPKILFNATGWITEQHVPIVRKLLGTPEVAALVGSDDKPRTSALPAPASNVPPPPSTTIAPGSPIVAAMPVAVAPAVSGPVSPAPGTFNPPAFNPPAALPEPAPAKKTRTKKQPEAPTAPMATPQFNPPAANFNPPAVASPPPFLNQQATGTRVDVPNATPAAAAVVTSPQSTDAELDNILNGMNL